MAINRLTINVVPDSGIGHGVVDTIELGHVIATVPEPSARLLAVPCGAGVLLASRRRRA